MMTLTYPRGDPIARLTAATARVRSCSRWASVSGCRSIWIIGMD
jgi:hypothetical protein